MTIRDFVRRFRGMPLARSVRDYLLWFDGFVFHKRDRMGPIQPKTVVFESYAGRNYSCSPRAIYEYMADSNEFSEWKFIWALDDSAMIPDALVKNPRTKIVRYESPEYFRAYGTAQYWVTNAMLPAAVRKRKGQKMLQCWHGTSLKRLRADVLGTKKNINGARDYRRKNRLDVPRFDAFTFQSAFGERTLAGAFQLERFGRGVQRLRYGLPRNTKLFEYGQADIQRIRAELGVPEGKKIVFYAPTWRDDSLDEKNGYVFREPIDYTKLAEGLGSDAVMLFRAHYMITERPDFEEFAGRIIDASTVADINDLYAVADVLITDYSSVFFDYAALCRPVVFFMKDLANYRDHLRGFYMDLEDLPGPVVLDEEDLITKLTAALDAHESAELLSGKAELPSGEYESWDSPETTRQVVQAFFGNHIS
ncbi:MAG: CDP-glycerol glycerophosphotransferase family protein [Ancrocorticia sp.]|uniref:CDP-glycerol glycerophosphotransferase family protein n=1 Tax=Ancrocorticia sp. TaxID=2593684 RepID=UPI003F9221C1